MNIELDEALIDVKAAAVEYVTAAPFEMAARLRVRNAAIVRAKERGGSLRQIARVAMLSPGTVQKIVRAAEAERVAA